MLLPHFHLPSMTALAGNQFTAGGIMLVAITAFVTFIKGLPAKLWAWLQRQLSVTITVVDNDSAFAMTREWIQKLPFTTRSRKVDLAYQNKEAGVRLNMGPGTHLFWYKMRPVWFTFARGEKQNTKEKSEAYTFRTLGRSQGFVRAMVKEIEAEYWSNQKVETKLYMWKKDHWNTSSNYVARTLDSVIMRQGEKEKLLKRIEDFQAAEHRYRQLGIPYHLGVELDGPPGTGKTSLASALGHHYKKAVYIFSLNDMQNDEQLKNAMENVYKGSIILFEDIDAMGVVSKRKDHKKRSLRTKRDAYGMAQHSEPTVADPAGLGYEVEDDPDAEMEEDVKMVFGRGVTLSGLLNVLDGLTAPDSVIYLMTTNHHDNLDPALLRPGRIDYRCTMSYAHPTQKAQLFHRFFPEATGRQVFSALAHRSGEETMAQFQGFLLQLLGDGGLHTKEYTAAVTDTREGLEEPEPVDDTPDKIYEESCSVILPGEHGNLKKYTSEWLPGEFREGGGGDHILIGEHDVDD
jgi:chaperone BCS1